MDIQPLTTAAAVGVPVQRQAAPETASTVPQEMSSATVTQQAPQSVQSAQPAQEAQPSRQELDKAVKAVSVFVTSVNNSLQFSVDDDSGRTVVKVIDTATKEVIKQIPSKEMLAIAKALDGIKGLLVHQKA